MSILWKVTIRDVALRLHTELDQIERHANENEPQLALQTVVMAERSLRTIRETLERGPTPKGQEPGAAK